MLDFYVSLPKEIAIIGDLSDAEAAALLDVVHGRFLPNKVVVGANGGGERGDGSGGSRGYEMPLLAERGMVDGKATAYVCQNYVCQLPVTDPQALAEQLDS